MRRPKQRLPKVPNSRALEIRKAREKLHREIVRGASRKRPRP